MGPGLGTRNVLVQRRARSAERQGPQARNLFGRFGEGKGNHPRDAAPCRLPQAVLALVTAGVLVYTTSLRRWAWGPGYIPVHVYPDQPRPAFPPPTPFTHVAETRRAYFWACALVLLVVTVAGFCATVAGVGLQTVPQLIDGDNRVVFTPGWSRRNTLIRVAVTAGCLAAGGFTVLDMWAVRSRVLAFFLAVVLFWLMVAAFVAFGFDLAEVLAAGEASCPLGSGVEVTCSQVSPPVHAPSAPGSS